MAQKKEANKSGKKGVKVQDLAPKKDAKGGFSRAASGAGAVSSNAVGNQQGSYLAGNKPLNAD